MCEKFMSREADCGVEFARIWGEFTALWIDEANLAVGEKGLPPKPKKHSKLFYYANGKWQIQVLVSHSRLRNEYLILEVCHSNFELKNNKKELFRDCLGSRGLIEFQDAGKKRASHLRIQVEVGLRKLFNSNIHNRIEKMARSPQKAHRDGNGREILAGILRIFRMTTTAIQSHDNGQWHVITEFRIALRFCSFNFPQNFKKMSIPLLVKYSL